MLIDLTILLRCARLRTSVLLALALMPVPELNAAVLEEVVVTARKREESLQDVPVAIQAFQREQIERYAATDLSRIADMANNVEITRGNQGGGGSFSIRGLGASNSDSGIDSSVAVNMDGVQTSRGFVARMAFFDLQSVEILKGPQALFYGKDSPAGVVALTSALPTPQFEARIHAGYEIEAEEKIVEAVVSGPLTENIGGRLAFRGTDLNGWLDNTAGFLENSNGEVIPTEPYDFPGALTDPGAEETWTARLTLDWQPSDSIDATLRVLRTEADSEGWGTDEVARCAAPEVLVAVVGVGAVVDPFEDCRLNHEASKGSVPREIATTWSTDVGDGAYWGTFESTLGSVNLNWQTPWGTLTSITGYFEYDFRSLDTFGGRLYPVYLGYNPDKHEQWSQELRFVTRLNGPVNYMVGVYADTFDRFHSGAVKLAAFGPDPVTGFGNDAEVRQYTDGDSFSVFGQAIWNVSDAWELSAGGRFTRDEKAGTQQNTYVHAFFTPGFVPVGQEIEASLEDNQFSPEVTMTWRPTNSLTAWAAYKTGYKSGGYSAPTVLSAGFTEDNIVFKPEEAEGGELGIKSTLLGNRLRLNATAYYYEFTNLQVSILDIETTTFSITNAAAAETWGIEFDAIWRVNDHLTLYSEGGYNRGEYQSFVGAQCYVGQTPATGCGIDLDGDGVPEPVQDLSGEPLTEAPEWSGSIGFEFVRPIGGNWAFALGGEGHYKDDYLTSEVNLPTGVQPSFWRYNARIGLHTLDGRWDLSVVGRNLSNEIWPIGGTRPGGIGGEDQSGGGSRPREVLFQMAYHL